MFLKYWLRNKIKICILEWGLLILGVIGMCEDMGKLIGSNIKKFNYFEILG